MVAETTVVARMVVVRQGRVSQLRSELEASWAVLQAGPNAP